MPIRRGLLFLRGSGTRFRAILQTTPLTFQNHPSILQSNHFAYSQNRPPDPVSSMTESTLSILRRHGIQPTPQRIAVAQYVLHTHAHPTADRVLDEVRKACPTISRATVYNTLNRFVEKGLLAPKVLTGGTVVFDPLVEPHHHFIDEETGRIYDVPWDAVKVTDYQLLEDFEVCEYQVVMRGRAKKR